MWFRLRRGRLVAAGACALAAAVLDESVKACWDARFLDGYDPELPLRPERHGVEEHPSYTRESLTFQGVAGERVPTLLLLPRSGSGSWPCVIFLHGIGQWKEFVDTLAPPFVEAGFAMACFDQFTRGERRLPDEAGPARRKPPVS